MTTIKDIARVAGVSITTVSRALNGYSDVSEKTRRRIQEVAKELKYSPNAVARSLVMNRSKTIGLLVSEISREGAKDNFTFEVLCGINDRVAELDYDLILFNTNSAQQKVKSYTQLCRERRVEGVILQGIKTDDPYLEEVIESDIPCVVVDVPITGNKVGYVSTDNVDGAKKAVQYLIDLGHQQIAMMNGHEKAFVSQKRKEGYLATLEQNEIPIKEDWILNGEFREEQAEKVALYFLRNHPNVTAIFCASDLMALGVLKAAKTLNIRVPSQLSVIGYDDIVLAEYATPSLTTVAQDKYQIGYEAAGLLIDLLAENETNNARILKSNLKIRQSTDFNKKA
ncbi:LacI family DNA-binding transcriptional regulator [Alkalihalophilus lindianensis]|uniref:LacI family DNA-binding transcriptional regulator n=2 Tax=Bacillaceae TaxID=186817 RepID=A0ABU3XEA3_9BACI|nr:LacI family DNA-binding transcriptional regulator [Alkalihalophilus lindianensis]MDV2686212.1 LacI family DNA-binding transcriptional regulator [Alkalihalophilus lindianensis]